MGVATGVFQLPNGSPVANGLYQWKLCGDAIAYSVTSVCVCPVLFSGNLDSNGNMTATFLFNDVLSIAVGNTCYQLTVKALGGGQVWNENYYLTGTAANINTFPPGGSGCGGSGMQQGQTLTLQTNGVNNSNQLLLNLVNGTNVTMTNFLGATTINASVSVSSILLETNGTTNTSQSLLNLVGSGPIGLTNSAGATTFTMAARTGLIGYNFSGGGSPVSAAVFGAIYAPVSMTATEWVLSANQTGTATLAIMSTSLGSYPAMTATIASPVLTGAILATATFAGVAIPAASLIEFSVTSASLVQTLNVGLVVTIP
jgi:hypothetical protein